MNMQASHRPEPRDAYPSRRVGASAAVIPRSEPVVYSEDAQTDALTPDQIKRYAEQGFLIIDRLFSSAEVGALQAELASLRSDEKIKKREESITEAGSDSVRSIFAVHRQSEIFARLARDSRLVRIAEYLLNDQVYLHQSRLNYKPGFRGREFYWHSDFETWHVEDGMPSMRALSMSISLTPNNSTNGPLLLIPGSHEEFLVCEGETPEQHYKSSLKKQKYGVPDDDNLARLVASKGIREFTGNPGSVCIFDCNTMHGSNSNISPDSRSNAFFVYNAMSNRVQSPFSGQPPRPEHICARDSITPINSTAT